MANIRDRFRNQWVFLIGALLTLAAIFAYQILQSHDSIERQEKAYLANLANVSADIIERHLAISDALLADLLSNPIKATDNNRYKESSKQIKKLVKAFPGTPILMALDSSGTIRAANQDELIGQNFAHRYYFTQAKLKNDPNLRIVSPLFDTVLKVSTFTISRAIRDENGDFAGVAVITLDVPFFSQLLSSTRYSADMWTMLVHGNGSLIMAFPEGKVIAREKLDVSGSLFSRHKESGKPLSLFTGKLLATGENRMVAMHTVSTPALNLDQPPVIAVTRDPEAIFAEWRKVSQTFAALLLLVALVAGVALAFFQRRAREHFKLLERQHAILQTATDGIHVLRKDGRLIDANPSFLNMLGLESSAIGSINIADIDKGQSREKILHNIKEASASAETLRLETQHQHHDGHLIDVEVHCRIFESDGEALIFASSRDITKRKIAESKLRRYQRLVEHAGDMLVMLDMAQCHQIINPTYAAMLGLPPDAILGKSLASVLGDTAYRQISPYIEVSLNREALDFTFSRQCGDSDCTFEVKSRPFYEGECQTGIALTFHDITALSEAQHVAKVESEMAKRYLATTQTMMVALDPDGNVSMINAAGCRLLGWSAEELIGNNWFDTCLPQPEGMTQVYPVFLQIMSGDTEGVEFFENKVITRSGTELLIGWSNAVLKDEQGRIIGTLGSGKDITHKRSAEEKLRKLSQAVEQSQESIMITNLVPEIDYVNEAFIRTTGYEREELIGKNPHIISSGQTPTETYKSMWRALAEGESWRGEMINRRKNGECYTESELISPMRRPDGEITHYLAIKEDITERKKLAQELEQHRHELSVLVTERTNELLVANMEIHTLNESLEARAEHAESASRAKSAFLANMSHEIRTPLNAVIGLNQLLQKEIHEPRQADRLRKSGQAANHLLGLINDILDLSKIEADRITLEHSDFALAHVFETISGLMSPKATEKGLSWHVQIDRHIPALINGDAIRVQQVLLNFASNALKFTEQGSIDLRARLIEQCADEIRIRFEICDTGIGISEEAQQRLFQSFEQADLSTTRKYGGTGLGLAISRKLAHLMHGDVGVISAPNSGSTFWFEAKFHASNAIPALQHLPLSLIQRRALVVHQNEALGAEIVHKLAALKIRAYPTKSVKEAKTRLETARRVGGPYDFVLLSDRLAHNALPGELGKLNDQDSAVNPAIFLISEGTQASTLPPALHKLVAGTILLPFDASLLHDLLLGELTKKQAGFEDEIAYAATPQESISLRAAHILLVEDNEINQEIARDMLNDAGLKVSLAANGQQAVDMVCEHTYELILMDMQMPVMDGLEATQAIRLLPAYATTPIIAMTANAFSEDKARCLAAGMNDHLAKPFTINGLLSALHLWLPAIDDEKTEPSGPLVVSENKLPGLQKIDGLDVNLGLMTLSGKTESYLRILRKFIDHHHDVAVAIRTALAEGNHHDARRFAHSTKGSGGMIGAVWVAERAAALEKSIENGDAEDYIERLLLDFERCITALCKAVNEALDHTERNG